MTRYGKDINRHAQGDSDEKSNIDRPEGRGGSGKTGRFLALFDFSVNYKLS